MTGKICNWERLWCSADGIPNQYCKMIRIKDLAPARSSR